MINEYLKAHELIYTPTGHLGPPTRPFTEQDRQAAIETMSSTYRVPEECGWIYCGPTPLMWSRARTLKTSRARRKQRRACRKKSDLKPKQVKRLLIGEIGELHGVRFIGDGGSWEDSPDD
jgi:hypothetical protein